jgi:hypothetical protein
MTDVSEWQWSLRGDVIKASASTNVSTFFAKWLWESPPPNPNPMWCLLENWTQPSRGFCLPSWVPSGSIHSLRLYAPSTVASFFCERPFIETTQFPHLLILPQALPARFPHVSIGSPSSDFIVSLFVWVPSLLHIGYRSAYSVCGLGTCLTVLPLVLASQVWFRWMGKHF